MELHQIKSLFYRCALSSLSNDNGIKNEGTVVFPPSSQVLEDFESSFINSMKRIAGICARIRKIDEYDASKPVYWRVSATACEFVKRFFLYNSMIRFDEDVVIASAVLLASKVEEFSIAAEVIPRLLRIDVSERPEFQPNIIKFEMSLLEGCNYQLEIQHPHALVDTILLDYDQYCSSQQKILSPSETQQWRREAMKTLKYFGLTYATFCLTATELALSALFISESKSLPMSFLSFVQRQYGEQNAKKIRQRCDFVYKTFLAPSLDWSKQ